MKTLPAGLTSHLLSGVTTLCWCWRLTRRDGVKQGFTDHDRDLTFDATTFEAAAGFSASEIRDSLGLAVDNLDVSGALSSAHLADADLTAGFYDDAKVEIFRVNWQNPAERVLMRTGSLGEVKRAGSIFQAEVRGLAHYLQQPSGRLFQYSCDADFGDGRCKVNAELSAYKAGGTVSVVDSARRFTASGLASFANGWFTHGLLTFTSGAADGQAIEVKQHTKSGSLATLELWQPARLPLLSGATFTIRAGCDKQISTCTNKFANAVNFRGFPHMPGNGLLGRINRPGGT